MESVTAAETIAKQIPRPLFISAAVHSVIRLGLKDCLLAVLIEDIVDFQDEVRYLSKLLDTYIKMQFRGYYRSLDKKYNLTEKSGFREVLQAELSSRRALIHELAMDDFDEETFHAWKHAVLDLLDAEDEILLPFEPRLQANSALRVLFKTGDGWDYVIKYIFVKLEYHSLWDMLGTMACDVYAAVVNYDKKCDELQKLLVVVTRTLSPKSKKRLQSIGLPIHCEDDENASQVSHKTGSESTRSSRPRALASRFQSPFPSETLDSAVACANNAVFCAAAAMSATPSHSESGFRRLLKPPHKPNVTSGVR